MDESNQRFLKHTKRFTLMLGIIYTIYSVLYMFISAGTLLASSIDWTDAGLSAEEVATINEAMTSFEMYSIYILTIAYIVLCVLMYIFNSKLKKRRIVSKIPYFLVLAIQVFNIINQIVSQSATIFSMTINGIVALLAILAIVNLSKLASTNEEGQLVV